MKKYLFILLAFGIINVSHAQHSSGKDKYDEQYEASKIAFITSKLQLTPKEAQSFWPVYNQYESEKDALWNSVKRMGSEEMAVMSERSSTEYLDNMLNYDRKKLKMKEALVSEMKNILPARKVAMLFVVEREFRKELLTQMKIRKPEK